MNVETPDPIATDASDLSRLAEFVGRLYLLLVTVVYDHPRWLPKDLRADYKAALTAVYPTVHRLQAALHDPGANGERGAEEVKRLLQDAGLSGPQLELKLAAYRRAEARFYGGRMHSETDPDRLFEGQGEVWLLPPSEDKLALEGVTSGGQKPRSRTLLEPALDAANILLGTLLSVFHVAEPYKEIKEGVEFGIKNGKLMGRVLRGASSGWTKLRGRVSRGLQPLRVK